MTTAFLFTHVVAVWNFCLENCQVKNAPLKVKNIIMFERKREKSNFSLEKRWEIRINDGTHKRNI